MAAGKKPSLLTLLLLMPFASVAAVLFTPALPGIANAFHISESAAGSAMTIFLLGYALGNLPYGPFAKRFGRKPAIYCGVALTLLGCLLVLFAGKILSWNLFLFGRFLTALGSSVGMKISFTMIADAFQEAEATKTVSLATLAFAVAPGLSIALGGFLTTDYGWESCFYAVLLYSLVILGFSIFLPETAPSLDREALNLGKIRKNYLHILKNKNFIYSAVIMGSVTSMIYLFSTLAPFLSINHLRLSPKVFGLMNCIPPLGLIGGSFVSHWLSTRRAPLSVIGIGIKITMAFTLGMLALFSLGYISIWTLFLPIPFLYFGTSLILNNASILSMHHVQDKSNGSAMMGFINMSMATVSVLIADLLSSSSFFLIPLFFLALTILMLILEKRVKNPQ